MAQWWLMSLQLITHCSNVLKPPNVLFKTLFWSLLFPCFLAPIVLSPSSSTGSSNVLTVRTRHFAFPWVMEFNSKALHGTVTLFHFYCSKIHISQNLPVSLSLRTQSGSKYLHNVVEASPVYISRTFSASITGTLFIKL